MRESWTGDRCYPAYPLLSSGAQGRWEFDRFFTELTGVARKKIVFWSRSAPLGPIGSRLVPEAEVKGGTKGEVAGLEIKSSGSKRDGTGRR